MGIARLAPSGRPKLPGGQDTRPSLARSGHTCLSLAEQQLSLLTSRLDSFSAARPTAAAAAAALPGVTNALRLYVRSSHSTLSLFDIEVELIFFAADDSGQGGGGGGDACAAPPLLLLQSFLATAQPVRPLARSLLLPLRNFRRERAAFCFFLPSFLPSFFQSLCLFSAAIAALPLPLPGAGAGGAPATSCIDDGVDMAGAGGVGRGGKGGGVRDRGVLGPADPSSRRGEERSFRTATSKLLLLHRSLSRSLKRAPSCPLSSLA